MCGRYKIEERWQEYAKLAYFDWNDPPYPFKNPFLGTVHNRAPMVLQPAQYAAWLEGGAAALSLVGVHPDADAFEVRPVHDAMGSVDA